MSESLPFATVEDMTLLWREMTEAEQRRAKALLVLVSDSLRAEGRKVGKSVELMALDPYYESVLKSVTVDVVARTLMTSTDQEPMTQFSQTAGPYSMSGTFLTPGGGLFIKRSELARLGLRQQRLGVLDVYGTSDGRNGHSV